ncbi:acidic phospholipase A2 1-like [Alosa sapidissima]|uniref:acidic phospholipase A2 1-like n=1 Tax=Alosa sapidissima TaxID=34773 RepID=UPI001C0931E9|nr:acidic phospholipase A2 1-like [Alosa sapidissima]
MHRCCEVHDRCYGDAIQHPKCWTFFDNPYTEIYAYTCDKANRTVTCSANKNTECEQFISECDRKAAECFATAGYNPENRRLPKNQCK